jgi:DNA-binding PadR family transcriptional regulator
MRRETQPATLGIEGALLGHLWRRPLHAFQLHQELRRAEALGLVWHLKQAHLYALLSKLEAAGLLTATTESQGTRPPRRILRLTPAGESAFQTWLATPVAHGRDFRLEFLAKLFFAARDGPAAASHLIAVQQQVCREWLTTLRTQVQTTDANRPYERLVLQFRLGQIEAILSWLRECEEALATSGARRCHAPHSPSSCRIVA